MRYRQRIAPRWIMLSLVVGGCSLWAPLATASPTYTVTDLGTVPGVDPKVSPGNYPIYPLAINSSGQVVGHWLGVTSDGSTREGTFLYSGGHMTDVTATGANGLGINDAGTMTRGNEVAINNAGNTVVWTPNGYYLNQNGSHIDLPKGFYPEAMNDHDVIAGEFAEGSDSYQAAIYSAGKVTTIAPAFSSAGAINNAGQVVGGAARQRPV